MLITQKHLLTGWFHCLTCSRKDSQESREISAAVRFVSDDFFHALYMSVSVFRS